MKYKLMGQPVFTCNLPGGTILSSSLISYATAYITLKSHTYAWCVTVCHSEQCQKTYLYQYKVPFPSPGRVGFCGLIPPNKTSSPPN